jgi:hypothetical protein
LGVKAATTSNDGDSESGVVKTMQTSKEKNSGGEEVLRLGLSLYAMYALPCWSSGPRGVELFRVVIDNNEGTDKNSDKELNNVLSWRNKSLSKLIFKLKYKSVSYSLYSTVVYYRV